MLDTKNSALNVDIHSGNCSEQSSKTRGVLLEGSNNKFWSLSLATNEFTLNSNQEPQKDALHLRGLLSECGTMFCIFLSLFALKQPRSQNLVFLNHSYIIIQFLIRTNRINWNK